VGTSAILKVNAERALDRLGLSADVSASDVAGLATTASDAQVILTSPELVERIPPTNADIVVIDNYFDVAELERKLEEAIG
jgi:PTS system ascorbate-specific IIB component